MEEKHMFVCPVCGSGEWIKRYDIGRWNIGECETCGFAQVDPLPLQESRAECYSEEKVVERNIKQKSGLQKFSRTMKRLFRQAAGWDKSWIFYDKLRRCLSPGSKILDVGCGDGSFLRKAKEDFNCTGIEISDYLASLARKQEGIKAITGNFLSTDFRDEKYDAITLISLLEHLEDPERAARKCFGLLNKGGALLLKTVNYGCLNRKVVGKGWTGFRPPDHVVYFSPSNLRMFLKKIGFSKIDIHAWPFNDSMYCEASK